MLIYRAGFQIVDGSAAKHMLAPCADVWLESKRKLNCRSRFLMLRVVILISSEYFRNKFPFIGAN